MDEQKQRVFEQEVMRLRNDVIALAETTDLDPPRAIKAWRALEMDMARGRGMLVDNNFAPGAPASSPVARPKVKPVCPVHWWRGWDGRSEIDREACIDPGVAFSTGLLAAEQACRCSLSDITCSWCGRPHGVGATMRGLREFDTSGETCRRHTGMRADLDACRSFAMGVANVEWTKYHEVLQGQRNERRHLLGLDEREDW